MYEVVKKFLYMNDFEPKWRKLKQYLGNKDKKLSDKPCTHEQVSYNFYCSVIPDLGLFMLCSDCQD